MSPDMLLVSGIVLCLLALISLLSAWIDGRPPRVGGIFLVTGIVLITLAMVQNPAPYRLAQLPDVFIRVIGKLWN